MSEEVGVMSDPEVCTFTFSNDLRVVLAPDNTFPLAAVSVHYDVGLRSEPPGFAGFAQLFEGLMRQGSESVEAAAHAFYVQSCGGSLGGETSMDYTNFYSVVPSAALERALFLEADRMRAPNLTEENLRRQIEAVKQKVRLGVLDQPYGGFPWFFLPSLLYRTFPNTYKGLGDFTDLDKASLDDCAAFFDTFYAPGNAVLTLAGDFDIEQARELVEQNFGDVPARPKSQRPEFMDPPRREIRGERHDSHAPLPALAVGYQLPDPSDELDRYLANVLLAALLSDGHHGRLQEAMQEDGTTVDVDAVCGVAEPFDARHPEMFIISLVHLFNPDRERLLGVIDDVLDWVSRFPPDEEELRRVAGRWLADHYKQSESLQDRVRALGKFELLYNDARIFDLLPSRMQRITAADVGAAASALRPDSRAVLTLKASWDTP